jgi:beta-lactamase regulating signal transducer with metallopeptidase domain
LVFSIAIPLINLRLPLNIPLNIQIQEISTSNSGILIQGDIKENQIKNSLSFKSILLLFYFAISTILLIRLIINLYRINNKIRHSERAHFVKNNIVLLTVPEQTLPYSYFRNIIVNKYEYENGEISEELLIHELAHCEQYHTLDILFVELIKLLLWFNPLVWLFKKEIQLNHEYLADSEVILKHDRKTYQNIILNLVFRNNSTYLASNFNYSLTKKRLVMMTINNSSANSMVRKVAIVPLVLFLAVSLSFSQQKSLSDSSTTYEKEWWFPILKKHDIELQAFNNFGDVFEMGTENTINDGIVSLKNATFIIKKDDNKYDIIRSSIAYHNIEKNSIKGENGSIESFSFDSKDIKSLETLEFTSLDVELCESCIWIIDDKGRIVTVSVP